MKQVVYIDVLFIINLIINYLLLLLGTKLMHTQEKRWRMLLGALLGAIYSVLAFFTPNFLFFTSSLVKLLVSVLLVLVSYRIRSLKALLKSTACFYCATFAFTGSLIALWFAFKPKGLLLNNGAVYFNISSLTLILSSVLAYAAVTLFSLFLKRNAPKNCVYQIRIMKNGKQISGSALMDTGNTLTDGFTDTPVIVASYSWISPLLPEDMQPCFAGKQSLESTLSPSAAFPIRLIPTQTVKGTGLLPAFAPDSCEITEGNKTQSVKRVLIAVTNEPISNGQHDVLLHTSLWNQ